MCDSFVRVRNCTTGQLVDVLVETNNTGFNPVSTRLVGQFVDVYDDTSGNTISCAYVVDIGTNAGCTDTDTYGNPILQLSGPTTGYGNSTISLCTSVGQHSEGWYSYQWNAVDQTVETLSTDETFVDAFPASKFGDCEDILTYIRLITDNELTKPYYIDGIDVINTNVYIEAKEDCNKSITFKVADYFVQFVENNDGTLSIYQYDQTGFGNPLKYDCCNADLMNALTNSTDGKLPDGTPIVGTGLFDWYNRIIDTDGIDPELKFFPYYIPSTEIYPVWCKQCRVTPTECSYPPLERPNNCYLLIPCDGTDPIVANNTLLNGYLNQFVTITSTEFSGCVYVVALTPGTCDEFTSVDIDTGAPACNCELSCYYVQNAKGFLYVDKDNLLEEVTAIEATPYIRVCSKVPPVPNANSVNPLIVNTGSCATGECEEGCYKLTNCNNSSDIIYTQSSSIVPYVYGSNNVVKINGKTNCYIASELDPGEICDCPIDVVVTSAYATCEACEGYKAYKLTSCETGDIKFTNDDLQAYIGKTIEIDCGCYLVSQINYVPQGATSITIDNVYNSCTECTTTYFQLRNCSTGDVDLYTTTDLSAELGKVIKIPGYAACFTVEVTRTPGILVAITVTDTYEICQDCIDANRTCKCQSAVNSSTVEIGLTYVDCEGNNATTANVAPGQRSDRYCALEWITGDDIIEYGDCTLVDNVFTCPPISYPKRPVIPGYSVPTCDIDKYEKITCNASEALYKSVLEKRYGISNCCPDDDMKWLLRKELIDLQAQVDSNYTCTSASSSCTGTSTCNCGCNNIIKSCDS